MEGDKLKLPLFQGNGTEDQEQYQSLCEAIWTMRQTMNDDVKKAQLVMNIQGNTLSWYMNIVQVPMGTPNEGMKRIQERTH